jgi:hypothetical protein
VIHRLCASCRRAGAKGALPYAVAVIGEDGTRPLVLLCADCADPARYSSDGLADAIIAEFARQLQPSTKGSDS